MRASLLSVVALTVTEALAAPALRPAPSDAEFTAPAVLGFDVTGVALPTVEEAFGLDAEMRAFVAPLTEIRDSQAKLAALLRGMEDRGLFSLEYAETTRTASATFHDRQGNCLSFTMLFVTLARAAGLTAAYQTVEVPPTWSYDGKVVIANHVNAAVKTAFREEVTVDFNIREYRGTQVSHKVSDSYALGLFYTNLGAEALLRDDRRHAFAYLRAAVQVNAEMPSVWVNLGVLYAREQRYDYAEAAYLRALEADPHEQSALANLVLVYQALGAAELAAAYSERVQNYRDRNPYYHFSLALKAHEGGQFAAALTALRKALRLKHDEYQFHALRALVSQELGRPRDAAQSAARALEYAEEERERNRSRVEFDALALR